jgi:hypothetical protein
LIENYRLEVILAAIPDFHQRAWLRRCGHGNGRDFPIRKLPVRRLVMLPDGIRKLKIREKDLPLLGQHSVISFIVKDEV